MKLRTALATGMIIAGGLAAGAYGAGCVDHYRKLDVAYDELYRSMNQEYAELKLKSSVEINMRTTRDKVEGCRQYRQSRKPMTERMQELCNHFEESLWLEEEKYQEHEQAEKDYREKFDEAEKRWVRHADEFWTHAGITTLGLFVAAAGYAVRKSAQNFE